MGCFTGETGLVVDVEKIESKVGEADMMRFECVSVGNELQQLVQVLSFTYSEKRVQLFHVYIHMISPEKVPTFRSTVRSTVHLSL